MRGSEGKRVQIVLIGNFYYTGVILNEDDFFITIRDKFNKEVSLSKSRIEKMEVLSWTPNYIHTVRKKMISLRV